MISKKAAALKPYTAGEQPADKTLIKLNTNENPYPPCPGVFRALGSFDAESLKLYPDPDSKALKKEIARLENAGEENIFLANGSDEILGFAFCALFDGNIAFADVTYSFYPVYCNLYSLSFTTVEVKDNFSVDVNDYINKNYGGVVIANPNAPSSLSVPLSDIERLIKKAACNVIVDEAYIDFAEKTSSAAPLVKKYDNLLVVKTLSKSYSLAGIRCGYAVGSSELIAALEKVKNSFNSYTLDRVCQNVSLEAIKDRGYFNDAVRKVKNTRSRVLEKLKAAGLEVLDSDANFLFVRLPGIGGRTVYERLRSEGILVRHFDKPRIKDYVRITIGTDEQMNKLIESIKSIAFLWLP